MSLNPTNLHMEINHPSLLSHDGIAIFEFVIQHRAKQTVNRSAFIIWSCGVMSILCSMVTDWLTYLVNLSCVLAIILSEYSCN